MKVISIREPFATLIKDSIKTIETRSWKTNYRGKIYIHSCVAKDKIRNYIKPFIKSKLMYGYILCSADLVDCIHMDDAFIEKEKKDNYNNFLCGKYEVGRYVWVLENIEILPEPIPAKGQLGI